ncbi:Peptidase propeptide and YPEB domain-containing protein [Lentibacillus halodurans]|uniref:Peptidase propeptide and YPEB domain-containing protein n=1 Tax=Lentibacillus halodurans TaxID=237679 RepID=A0A1I0XTB5_9BACI|nr:PepSY domain-containing protein [Lentibacillus halodurans]SFB04389.1 Peptidase propeptide and YPEB domain-containing protein [Lentibacillus halodurans]
MKKRIGFVLVVILGISALGLGMFQSSASEASPKLAEQEIRDLITAQYPGKITELELDEKGNQAVYEAEIQDNGTDYEIKLDGNTGEVLELDKTFAAKDNNGQNSSKSNAGNSGNDDDSTNNTKQNSDKKTRDDTDDVDDGNNNNGNQDNTARVEINHKGNSDGNQEDSDTAVISTAEAEEIAQNEFSGTIVELDLDEDDGRLYYEFEMKSNNKEADIEIDAYTGEILVMEIDHEEDDNDDD